ncbi:MAG: porin family protein, partial [Caulobacteraceae bacterium]
MALAPQAMAQESGWYGAFDLGYHWPEAIETESSALAADGDRYKYEIQQEDNLAGFIRLGYQINPNWRVELEGGARTGDIDSIRGDASRLLVPDQICGLTPPTIPCTTPPGSIEAYTLMANVIYDFFPNSRVRPFIGAGVGINHVKADIAGRFNDNPLNGAISIDDDDTAYAYQVLAGAAFDITDRLTADVTYRYLSGTDLDLESETTANPLVIGPPGTLSGRYEDQSVTFGLRYS